MKNNVLLVIFILLLSSQLYSQIKFQKTYHPGGMMDLFTNATQTSDGGYIISGNSMGFPPMYSNVVKVDTAGTIQWAKEYGDGELLSFVGIYMMNDVKATSDGGFIMTGECQASPAFGSAYDDLFLIKTDASGNTQWTKAYGGSNMENGNFVLQTSDGGYIAVGTSYSFGAKDSANIYIVKTNSTGTMQWDRAVQISPNDDDVAYAVEEAADGFIVVGSTEQVFAGVDTTRDIVILKTDPSGVVQWLKTYGEDYEDEYASSIELINSGSIIISGSTTKPCSGLNASDAYIFDIDGSGNITWSSAYDIGLADEPQCVKKTSDGGYAILGFTMNLLSFPRSFLMKAGNGGAINWAMHYGSGLNFSIFTDGQQTIDDGFIIGTIGLGAGYEYYLIKTDENGVSGCNESTFAAAKTVFSPVQENPAHTDYNGGSGHNIVTDVNAITPTETTYCIEVPCDTPIVTIAPVNPTICEGSPVTLTASGATTYSWNTGATTAAISVSPSTTTTYTVIGTTGGICPSNPTQVTVTVNPAPNASISGTTTICNGASTTLTASGGTSYSWSSGSGTASTTVSPTSNTTYTVTVTDGTGCTATASQLVTVNPLPTISISGNTSVCLGGSTTLTASGGSTYSWSSGDNTASTTISPTSSTTYTVTVTTAAGCSSTSSQLVTVNTLPVPSISGNTTICDGESTILTASGGDTYSWDTGDNTAATTINPSTSTTYNVTVTNTTTGCTATASQLVTVNPLPNIVINGLAAVCDGNPTTLTATGGDTYLWSTGDPTDTTTVSPSTATTYFVTVTISGTGCSDTGSQLVLVNSAPVISISGDTIICEGESTSLTVSGGGDTYSWSSGDNTAVTVVSPLTTTNYIVTVTDGTTGCFTIENQDVIVNPIPVISFTGDTSLCIGDSTIITASGGDSYLWSTTDIIDNISVMPSIDTDYYVTVTNSTTLCFDVDTISVFVHPLPTAIASGTTTTCQGVQAQLTANGGTSYIWSPAIGLDNSTINNPIATPDTTTTYTVTVINDFGCSDDANVTVTINPAPQFSLSSTNISCNNASNGSASVNIISGVEPVTYIWSTTDTSSTISNLSSGYYNITVTDAIGCSAYDSVLISEPQPLTYTDNISHVSCYGLSNGSITLVVSGGTSPYLYSWSNSATSSSISGLAAGTYSVTITDNNGCTLTIPKLDVNQPTEILYTVLTSNASCYGENDGWAQAIVTGGTPSYTYLWSNTQTASTNIALTSGIYNLTITDSNGCTETTQATITEPLEIVYTDEITDASCIGNFDGEIILSVFGGTTPYTYLWSNQETDSVVADLYAGEYTVTITDDHDCQFSETFEVGEVQISCLEIPTLFTPNGDGTNDYWEIKGIGLYPNCEIEIFNRWGDKIFESKGYTEPWDGTFNGKELPISSYVFILNLNDSDGSEPIQGIVTIKY